MTPTRRSLAVAVLACIASAPLFAAPAPARADLSTAAERSGFVRTGRYEEVIALCDLEELPYATVAGILDCLSSSIEAVDDKGVNLPLDLVIDAPAGIEAVRVVGRLDLAGYAALLVGGVEVRDRPRPAHAREQVGPGRLDIATQRGDETQSGYDHSTHRHSPELFRPKRNRPNPCTG